MKNYFFAAVMAFIFFTLKNNAPAMDQLTYDEIRWAPTKLKPLLLDNTITTNYCSQEATRFRGCAAAVELFASFLNPAIGLSLNNDEFSLIESDNYKLENSNFKKFQEHQRKKLTQFEKNMNEKSIASLIDTYLALRKLNPSPKPHEVALSLNAFMAVAYDPHKLYAPMFQYNGQYRVTLKPFIGVELEIKNNQLTLSNIVINTAAELAGLKVGDVIVSINDGPVNINEETDVDNFFDFKDNEKVKLKILRKEREFDVTIQFSLTSKGSIVDRKIDFKGEKYSYLYMGEVPSDLGVKATCNIFSNFLKKFNAQTTGIVLDLRNNVGGPGETAACIAGLFLGTGTHIYSEVDLTNSTLKKRLAIMPKVFNKKIIVLVNGKTASSGEIIAQALQFHSRALILGDRTYGKAIGQTQQDFKIDRITYYETSEKALQPDGSSYHGRGVIPDYYVYREGLEISDREKETLREEDLAIFPLKIENGIFYKKRSTPLNFPSKCVKEDVVRKSVDSLDDRDWKKDFQLQFALETLRCL